MPESLKREDAHRAYSLGLYEKALPAEMSFAKMLEETALLGFDRLEISIDESDRRLSRLEWSCRQKHELSSLMGSTGVPIRTMCLSAHRKYPLGSPEPAVRARSLDIMRRAIDFAFEVGLPVIQLAGYDVYYEQGSALTRELFEQGLRQSVEMAAGAGVVLAFETMETPFMDTVGKAMRYVSSIASPWLGVYPDIGNLQNAAALYGHTVAGDLELGAGHIFALHLKETRPGIYRDMRFGEGHTDHAACLSCARKMGVRMFTGEFWHQSGQDHRREVAYAAEFLRGKLDAAFV